ncbi:MAG: adenylosuccinate lyase [Deltaproteobacteria bacterium]|nr:adenylosuccinate lyase [Deltaproteobacteria bacterium]
MTNQAALKALSPLDGRYLDKVTSLCDYFSEYGLIKYRTKIEIEWLIMLAGEKAIETLKPFSSDEAQKLREIYLNLTPTEAQKVKDIEKVTNHDVKAIEYYLNQKLTGMGFDDRLTFIHFACTSEDINNLAYALMIKDALENEMLPLCEDVFDAIKIKSEEYRDFAMMSKTHGQPASPTTMGKEFFNVHQRLTRQFGQMKKQEILGKINGAVGNFNAHVVSFPDLDWRALSKRFVLGLGITYNPATTQIEPHDYLAEVFHLFCRFNNILVDFSRDIWLYISFDYFKQKAVKGQVGSSTMPHKINPIDFENAEGNLGLANAMFEFLARKLPRSRLQRDLTDSTVLRNIGVGFGYSMIAYRSFLKGVDKLVINRERMEKELSEAWSLLGEALQTVMRKHEVPNSYEKLKDLTRGKAIDQDSLSRFIDGLGLPENEKQRLKKLTPLEYLGLAKKY